MLHAGIARVRTGRSTLKDFVRRRTWVRMRMRNEATPTKVGCGCGALFTTLPTPQVPSSQDALLASPASMPSPSRPLRAWSEGAGDWADSSEEEGVDRGHAASFPGALLADGGQAARDSLPVDDAEAVDDCDAVRAAVARALAAVVLLHDGPPGGTKAVHEPPAIVAETRPVTEETLADVPDALDDHANDCSPSSASPFGAADAHLVAARPSGTPRASTDDEGALGSPTSEPGGIGSRGSQFAQKMTLFVESIKAAAAAQGTPSRGYASEDGALSPTSSSGTPGRLGERLRGLAEGPLGSKLLATLKAGAKDTPPTLHRRSHTDPSSSSLTEQHLDN